MTRPRCGTERGYRAHIFRHESTCAPCRAAHSTDVKDKLNRPRSTTPARAQRHVDELLHAGMTITRIAERAGLTEDTIGDIRNGRKTRILADTEAAILGVNPDRTPTALVDATGTKRRIQALLALGWRHRDISDRSGVRTSVLLYQRTYVTTAVADRISAAYDAMCMTHGPSATVVGRAARLGYIPPLGWDDDIDDPAAWANVTDDTDVIDDEVVRRLCDGKDYRDMAPTPTRAERIAAAERLHRSGVAQAEVGRRLSLRPRRDFARWDEEAS